MDFRSIVAVLTVCIALAAFLFGVVSWRMDDIDQRLDERMNVYHYQIDSINKRLESIEEQLRIHRSLINRT